MHTDRPMEFNTKAVHAGTGAGDAFGALNTPIVMSSTFKYDALNEIERIFTGQEQGYIYSRGGNPTIQVFEERMAALEGGLSAVAFATGMAAISAVLMSFVKSGDEVIASRTLYGSTYGFLTNILPRYGVKTHFVDAREVSNIEPLINGNTRVIYFETPANPSLDIADISAISEIAKNRNIKVVVDNTFATPVNQKPLELGADVVVHSATKYICGNGSALGGVAIAKDEDYLRELRFTFMCDIGGAMSPFNAWLMVQGLKTLPTRMRQHQENALDVARFLSSTKKVKNLRYPGLPDFPQHDLAARQMKGFGAMITFDIEGGYSKAAELMDKFELCTLAVSLGDCETLVEHPATMTHRGYDQSRLADFGMSDAMIRLSIGLEDVSDIIADLDRALFKIN